jgi:hypothetical protein
MTLRGITYDEYTGAEWRRSEASRRATRHFVGKTPGSRWVPVTAPGGAALWRVRVTDLTGRTDGLLFLMPDPERVQLSVEHANSFATVAADGTVTASNPVAEKDAYAEDARDAVTARARLAGLRSDATVAPWPALVAVPDAAFYAARARGLAPDEGDAVTRATRIEAGLRAGWPYRLRAGDGEKPPSVREFLEKRTPASCEWFASAMVLMMRAHGHPARLAVGFRAGPRDFMHTLGEWSLRANHAHAWCEVWFEGAGWAAFDPTPGDETAMDAPPDGRADADEPGLLERLARWRPEDREWLGRRVGEVLDAALRVLPHALLAAAAAGLLVLLLRRVRRRRGSGAAGRAGARGDVPALLPAYRRAVRSLEGAGVVRGTGETASEYAGHAGRAVPEAAPPLTGLTRTYEALRFGGREPGEPERAAADAAASAIERAAAAKRRGVGEGRRGG